MDESAEGVREEEILTTCVSDAQQGAGQMRTVREVRRFVYQAASNAGNWYQ